MKKITILSIIVASFILFLSTSNVFAKQLDPSLGPYMTDKGSTVGKDVFGWDEKPYAFIQFDVDQLNTNLPLFVKWKWKFIGNGPSFYRLKKVTDFSGDPLNIWNSIGKWDKYKKVGEWKVKTTWWNIAACSGKGGKGRDESNFTVTPEPVSSVLFLVGSISLAAARLRRRKK